jgi:hypothetical protein
MCDRMQMYNTQFDMFVQSLEFRKLHPPGLNIITMNNEFMNQELNPLS